MSNLCHLLRDQTEAEEEETQSREQHDEVEQRAIPHRRDISIETEHRMEKTQVHRNGSYEQTEQGED